ncbi:sigma factor-like helix-turn-helix DNA-binding protein [Actinocrispum wychmicini]|uniref:RNA polymerase sigma-70 factor (ECF subfamily) n=1 Tax=Actinocrispum wychmicini TaxID=1213861 RepID=A0A4R2JUI0_9PSEU|nr:sigma factor-like helix-turn-helix DNA-binding protein [Actinocrispum wychmicini]TCO62702.1 RNA polymerase sigma-70 factor (ECF subfamily) [Actinocrispum wychmicini]
MAKMDLDQVLSQTRPVIVRYCRARIGRRRRSFGIADAVATNILQAVLRALPVNRKPLLALVYGIAVAMVDEALVDSTARIGSDALVPWLLEELPWDQREILVLRVAVGLTAEQTAEAMGYPVAVVRVTQHRALSRMRTATQPQAV